MKGWEMCRVREGEVWTLTARSGSPRCVFGVEFETTTFSTTMKNKEKDYECWSTL